ncbi:MAG: PH domain-containing protein [Gordonia sp. (in: high G+C Gram-positive bacteria)]
MPETRKPEVRWDLEYRSRRLRTLAIVAAIVVLAIHITFGLLLTISDTGPHIGWGDQAAIIGIGVVIAGAVLTLTRPRVRVGPAGVSVRNLATERCFGWDQVCGLTYPDRGFGGQLEFPADEHIPVLAIQAADGDLAIAAMERYRELALRYRPSS